MVGNLAEKVKYAVTRSEEIPTEPLKWCVIPLSEVIAKGKRFEASVFDVDGKHARELVQNCKYTTSTIGGETGLATSYTCARFKRIWVEKSDYPIFQPSTIMDIKPAPDGYISGLTQVNIESLRVKKGQILLTCSGTIGNVTLVSDTLDNAIFSHDLLRIDCKSQDDIGYIYAYLKSDVGRKILLTKSYGAVVTHIEPEHLAEVIIPNPPAMIKRTVNEQMVESFSLRDESNKLLDEAMQIMKIELKLPSIEEIEEQAYGTNADVKSFNTKLSELSGRIDASSHVPIVRLITEKLKESCEEVTTLDDTRVSTKIFLPGRFKRNYVSKGYGTKFFGIKQITSLDPMTDKYLAMGKISKIMRDELALKEGMLLISRSGTIGNLCIVPKHWTSWIASEDLIRVDLKDDICGYIYCFLSSEYGQMLIKKSSFGSVQDHIDCDQIAKIPVPILNNNAIQVRINNLVREANEKRNKAYEFEQNALMRMNEIINSR